MAERSEKSPKATKERLEILVVDDDVDTLALVNHELKALHNIHAAENAVRAMEILKKNDIQIVLCDERLKLESGSELLAEIKQQYPEIVRILISGYTDTHAVMNAINKANVFKYIIKPWGNQLKSIIDEAHQYYLASKKNQYRDSLTSLRSENTILDSLYSELKRASRYNTSISVVLISVSNPKQDSELHAFLVDRFLLKRIADILASELRESDMAGRLSDNHFLALLTETDEKGAGIFVKRLLEKIDCFEKEVNRGLLPYVVKSASYTAKQENTPEEEAVLKHLYRNLAPPANE